MLGITPCHTGIIPEMLDSHLSSWGSHLPVGVISTVTEIELEPHMCWAHVLELRPVHSCVLWTHVAV